MSRVGFSWMILIFCVSIGAILIVHLLLKMEEIQKIGEIVGVLNMDMCGEVVCKNESCFTRFHDMPWVTYIEP